MSKMVEPCKTAIGTCAEPVPKSTLFVLTYKGGNDLEHPRRRANQSPQKCGNQPGNLLKSQNTISAHDMVSREARPTRTMTI